MKRLLEDLRRYRWFLFAACAMLLLARWWLQRGRPERLMNLSQALVGLHNGEAYFVGLDARQENLIVRAVPVTGGRGREVGREVIKGANVHNLIFTDAGIFYVLVKSPTPQAGDSFLPSTGGVLGTTMPPPGDMVPLAPGVPSANRPHAALRCIPLSGGPPRDMLSGPDARAGWREAALRGSTAIVGRSIYWINAHPDGKGVHGEPRSRSDLMATPLEGGPSRRRATGLYEATWLCPGKEGVFWLMPDTYGDLRGDLYYLRASESQPAVLHEYEGRPPVELGDRLYWIERVYKGKPGLSTGLLLRTDLVVANADGSDRHVLFALPRDKNTALLFSRLTVHRGRLYVLTTDYVSRTSAASNRRATLYRLDPARPQSIETLYVFPQHSMSTDYFDGDYYYFTITEEHENPFDWSTAGLFATHIPVLYRYRLPG